jgi:hypothetical protein
MSLGTIPISSTWEKLGLLPWLFSIVGLGVVLFLFFNRSLWWRTFVYFVVGSGVMVVVRYVVMVGWFVGVDDLSLFWDPVVMFVGFMPVGVLLVVVFWRFGRRMFVDPFGGVSFTRCHVIAGFFVFICVGSVVGAVGYDDPGVLKEGRVLIDEVHSDWEDSDRPLDTEWFGLLSTYNYYSWAEWMNVSYHVERNVDQMFSDVLLADVDVLILKCPTSSYSTEEVDVIARFVEGGGGLWMIGDHTDVFGMNTFLNQVGSVFGIHFRNDATYELGSGNMTFVSRPQWFVHPIMRDVSRVNFMTSCSLEAPFDSENVILGRGLIAEPGTYATENFFRESVESAEAEFGMFLQMVGVKYGLGRVVAFSDSTVFSSFSFFSDGYQDLTHGTLDYLNRMNSSPPPSLILWFAAVLFGGIALFLLRRRRKQEIVFTLFVAGVVAIGMVYPLVSYLNDENILSDINTGSIDMVMFDMGHTDSSINLEPTVSLFEESDNFGTLYVWSQRLGLIPDMIHKIDDSLFDSQMLVIINPSVSYQDNEIARITQFVDMGGSVVVFDSIQNPESTANEVLGRFGLWLYVEESPIRIFSNSSDNASYLGNMSIPKLQISGGTRLGIDSENVSYIKGVEIENKTSGKIGKVVVVIDAYSFSNKILGGPLSDPDDEQLALYDTVFYLYRYLSGIDII